VGGGGEWNVLCCGMNSNASGRGADELEHRNEFEGRRTVLCISLIISLLYHHHHQPSQNNHMSICIIPFILQVSGLYPSVEDIRT
jgi:hypothetical protein